MKITDQLINQAYSELKATCGGVCNDYFGLLYLEQEFDVPRDEALNMVAFGGNDYGVDGFFFDRARKNFYLFQFKYTVLTAQFKGTFQRLIDKGMEIIFDAKSQDANKNDLLLQINSCLRENQAVIEKVYIHFVFMGDPAEAERSITLDKLKEDLGDKKHLVDKHFGRPVSLDIEFRSAKTRKVGSVSRQRTTRTYSVSLPESLTGRGPNGEQMLIGFVKLTDLNAIYQEMGQRFFQRNIRSALPEAGAVNRALARAFKKIVIGRVEDPSVFVFNHNGVTFAAEKVEKLDGEYKVTEPRLLNGAQTITTFAKFVEANADNPALKEGRLLLEQIRVICKIITEAEQKFITAVTINNNRQNPIEPWNLHANDMIQLELQDKFRDERGVYYERQEKAFDNLSDDELDDLEISERRPIELLKLTKTFLVVDGEIDKMSWMSRVFEEDRIYDQVFNQSRLCADLRKVLLCYKVQFCLSRLMKRLLEKLPAKYWFINRARPLLWALICQGMLNDPKLENIAENFGCDMTMPVDFTDYLSRLVTSRCQILIRDLLNHRDNVDKIAEGKFSFLKTNVSYRRCMEFASKQWKWAKKNLR